MRCETLGKDGKKIAVGYGELGEEDWGGLEQPPTLTERKDRIENGMATLKEIQITISISVKKPLRV